MRMLLLYLANWVSAATPLTRWFRLRAVVFRAAGVHVDPTAKLNGRVTVQLANLTVGARTWVGANTTIVPTHASAVVLGADCDVSQDCLIVCGTHEIGPAERRAGKGASAPITVGDGTWIGARVTLTAGTTIGRGCVVAAGAVVRGQFEENLLIAGVPARVVREL